MKLSILLFGLSLVATAQPAFALDLTLRAECRKDSDRGCTATATVCESVPDGQYIVPGSIGGGSVVNFWSKQPICGAGELGGYVAVPGTDLPFPPSYPTSVCAWMQVQSGSGLNDLGKVAFVNCNYSVRTFTYP